MEILWLLPSGLGFTAYRLQYFSFQWLKDGPGGLRAVFHYPHWVERSGASARLVLGGILGTYLHPALWLPVSRWMSI